MEMDQTLEGKDRQQKFFFEDSNLKSNWVDWVFGSVYWTYNSSEKNLVVIM